ncbi:MAG: hypothetical protein V3T99_00370 [Nitrososphaerales archaeon]
MTTSSNLTEILESGNRLVGKLPGPIRDTTQRELRKIREFLLESRPPRSLITGRRGMGKSSSVNAIFERGVAPTGAVISTTGEPKWWQEWRRVRW